MAKAPAKTAAKTAPKKAAAPKASKSVDNNIEKACEDALAKLRSLGVQEQLQNDIEWCLGSFRSDGNPVGLYAMAERALAVFQEEKARKNKGVTAKSISDLEKILQERK
jgi:hypothetical protein